MRAIDKREIAHRMKMLYAHVDKEVKDILRLAAKGTKEPWLNDRLHEASASFVIELSDMANIGLSSTSGCADNTDES